MIITERKPMSVLKHLRNAAIKDRKSFVINPDANLDEVAAAAGMDIILYQPTLDPILEKKRKEGISLTVDCGGTVGEKRDRIKENGTPKARATDATQLQLPPSEAIQAIGAANNAIVLAKRAEDSERRDGAMRELVVFIANTGDRGINVLKHSKGI